MGDQSVQQVPGRVQVAQRGGLGLLSQKALVLADISNHLRSSSGGLFCHCSSLAGDAQGAQRGAWTEKEKQLPFPTIIGMIDDKE